MVNESLIESGVIILLTVGVLYSLVPYIYFSFGSDSVQSVIENETRRLSDNLTNIYISSLPPAVVTALSDNLSSIKTRIMTDENLQKNTNELRKNNNDIVDSIKSQMFIGLVVFGGVIFLIRKFVHKFDYKPIAIKSGSMILGAVIAELLFLAYVVGEYKPLNMSDVNIKVAEYTKNKTAPYRQPATEQAPPAASRRNV